MDIHIPRRNCDRIIYVMSTYDSRAYHYIEERLLFCSFVFWNIFDRDTTTSCDLLWLVRIFVFVSRFVFVSVFVFGFVFVFILFCLCVCVCFCLCLCSFVFDSATAAGSNLTLSVVIFCLLLILSLSLALCLCLSLSFSLFLCLSLYLFLWQRHRRWLQFDMTSRKCGVSSCNRTQASDGPASNPLTLALYDTFWKFIFSLNRA